MTKETSDCLVIKIEEVFDGDIDMILFILYDNNEEYYLVTGKRNYKNENPQPIPYKFYCKYANELIDFISIVICKNSKINYTLYNYDDLPNNTDEIDFNYLNNLDNNIAYELSGYDNQNYNKKTIMKYLRILKNVFNYY
jgi:hypothetical protein